MTLADERVEERLTRNFISGMQNIAKKKSYAGKSNRHLPTYDAMWINNCAGNHNIQMFFLTSDGRLLHALPGYWGPSHFLEELDLAVELGRLYYARELSAAERNAKYLDMHLAHAYSHAASMVHDSGLQGFDRKHLEERKESDFQRTEGFLTAGLKTPDQVLHERLAEVPFRKFESFDVAKFIDMGVKTYKYDYGMPMKDHGCKCGKKCACGDGCKCGTSPGKPPAAAGPGAKGAPRVR